MAAGVETGHREYGRGSRTIRAYAAFNVRPTDIDESGLSNTKLLPAPNATADCLVLSVIANDTAVRLDCERRTCYKIARLCPPNPRSTTTASNFRMLTRVVALGIAVHTSVSA